MIDRVLFNKSHKISNFSLGHKGIKEAKIKVTEGSRIGIEEQVLLIP